MSDKKDKELKEKKKPLKSPKKQVIIEKGVVPPSPPPPPKPKPKPKPKLPKPPSKKLSDKE